MLGCLLAGVYTEAALGQLRSHGFKVLFFPYSTVVKAFQVVGVDAGFDESTTEAEFKSKLRQWKRVPKTQKQQVWQKLLELNADAVEDFVGALERTVARQIAVVRVVPLHGRSYECFSVQEAIAYLETYNEKRASGPFVKYEVQVRYDNGDRVEGQFREKSAVIEFLITYTAGGWSPVVPTES